MEFNIKNADQLFLNKKYDDALKLYETALSQSPQDYRILSKIALIYHIKKDVDKAIEYYEKSLKINKNQPDIHNNLGMLYQSLNIYDKAIEYLKNDLNSYENLFNLGILFEKIGKIKESKKFFHRAIKFKNEKKFSLQTKIAFTMPVIYESRDHIESTRKRILDFIKNYNSSQGIIKNPVREIGVTTFYLGYHGVCNVEINKKIADFYCKHIDKNFFVTYKSSKKRGKKIKIGFISAFFRKHSVSDVSNGWISQLDNNSFETYIFSIGTHNDKTINLLKKNCFRFFNLPQDIKVIQETLLKQNLDILFFTDIGLEPITYFLAFSRYAPVQITYTGHPDTSGIKSIDYYISSKYWEKEDAENQYSERLIQSDSLTWYYRKPDINSNFFKPREFYGFSEKDNIYTIAQSLFKIHPDFDYVLEKISNNDKNAKIVIFYDEKQYWWKNLLLERFKNSIEKSDKIRFLPQFKFDYYLNFLTISDVVLDTVYFNGGLTSLQTIASGTPIVTMPYDFMRSRFTYGMLKKIGINDTIAKDFNHYIDIALDYANNKDKNEKLRKKTVKNNSLIFNDNNVIKDFEKIFKELV